MRSFLARVWAQLKTRVIIELELLVVADLRAEVDYVVLRISIFLINELNPHLLFSISVRNKIYYLQIKCWSDCN